MKHRVVLLCELFFLCKVLQEVTAGMGCFRRLLYSTTIHNHTVICSTLSVIPARERSFPIVFLVRFRDDIQLQEFPKWMVKYRDYLPTFLYHHEDPPDKYSKSKQHFLTDDQQRKGQQMVSGQFKTTTGA